MLEVNDDNSQVSFVLERRRRCAHRLKQNICYSVSCGTHLKPWNQEEKQKLRHEKKRNSNFFLDRDLNFTSTVLRLEKQRHPTVATLESQNTFINSKFIKKYVVISIFRTVQVCFQTILNSKVKTENQGLNWGSAQVTGCRQAIYLLR